MPVKLDNGAGKIELYTKIIMKIKFKLKSPNLADPVMMTMRFINPQIQNVRLPKPIRTLGLRSHG